MVSLVHAHWGRRPRRELQELKSNLIETQTGGFLTEFATLSSACWLFLRTVCPYKGLEGTHPSLNPPGFQPTENRALA